MASWHESTSPQMQLVRFLTVVALCIIAFGTLWGILEVKQGRDIAKLRRDDHALKQRWIAMYVCLDEAAYEVDGFQASMYRQCLDDYAQR